MRHMIVEVKPRTFYYMKGDTDVLIRVDAVHPDGVRGSSVRLRSGEIGYVPNVTAEMVGDEVSKDDVERLWVQTALKVSNFFLHK